MLPLMELKYMGIREKLLISRLYGTDFEDVIHAVRELAELESRAAVPALIELLERSLGHYHKRSLASAVIEALGRLKVREAEPILLRALDSKMYYIKAEAAEALGELDPSEHAIDEIKEVISEDVPNQVKKDAIHGLAKAGGRKAVEYLIEVARTEPDEELKHEAVEAVAEVDGEMSADPLIDFYHREASGKLKADVINALARIGSAGTLELLGEALGDSNPNVRSCAALALGEVGKAEAEPSLRALLGDPVEYVRKSAAKALGMIRFLPRSA